MTLTPLSAATSLSVGLRSLLPILELSRPVGTMIQIPTIDNVTNEVLLGGRT